VLTLLGIVLVVTGALLAIIGTLGAIGSSLQVRTVPGRVVQPTKELGGVHGRAMVHGRAAAGPGGVYPAPLSGRPCVWYLASQSAVRGEERQTQDRFAPQPFVIEDDTGRVLVGPRCPALEQITPSYRSQTQHPWFGVTATAEAERFEVFEFIVPADTALTASGEVLLDTDGPPRLGGDVVLSLARRAAQGDPARFKLRRDLTLAFAGALLVVLGALAL